MGQLSKKSTCVAYLWWFFLGIFGAHRFYLRKWCTAVIWLCTGGLFLIGWIIDICLIPGMVSKYNYEVTGEKSEIVEKERRKMRAQQQPAEPAVVNVYA